MTPLYEITKEQYYQYLEAKGKKEVYDEEFYKGNYEESAEIMANVVVSEILKIIKPKNVVDFGCGIGIWLKHFKLQGVKEILGVDYNDVEDSMLRIDKSEYLSKDLTKPLKLDKKYDLATSFEVVEHLPEESADTFVDSLTNASDRIFFGAAIPDQGGRDHVNEQYPNYWVKKFQKRGFVCLDILRPRLLLKEDSSMSSRQNILLFIKLETLREEMEEYLPYYQKDKKLVHRTVLMQSKPKIIRGFYKINQKLGGLFNSVFDKVVLKVFTGDLAEVV